MHQMLAIFFIVFTTYSTYASASTITLPTAQDVPQLSGVENTNTTKHFPYCVDATPQTRWLKLAMPANFIAGELYPVIIILPRENADRNAYTASMARMSKQGLISIAIDYRKNTSSIEDLINMAIDARCAVRWVKALAQQTGNPFRIDPDRISIMGDSLGSLPAQMLALLSDQPPLRHNAVTTESGLPSDPQDYSLFRYATHNMLGHFASTDVALLPSADAIFDLGAWFNIPEGCWRNQTDHPYCGPVNESVNSDVAAVVLDSTFSDTLSWSTSCTIIHGDFLTADKKSLTVPVPMENNTPLCGPYKELQEVNKGMQYLHNILIDLPSLLLLRNYHYDNLFEDRFLRMLGISDISVTQSYPQPSIPQADDAEIIYPNAYYLPAQRRILFEKLSPIHYRTLANKDTAVLIIADQGNKNNNWYEGAMLASMLQGSGFFTKMIRYDHTSFTWPSNHSFDKDLQIASFIKTATLLDPHAPQPVDLQYARIFSNHMACNPFKYRCPYLLIGNAYHQAWANIFACQSPYVPTIAKTCLHKLISIEQTLIATKNESSNGADFSNNLPQISQQEADAQQQISLFVGAKYQLEAIAYDKNYNNLSSDIIWELYSHNDASTIALSTGKSLAVDFTDPLSVGTYTLTIRHTSGAKKYNRKITISVTPQLRLPTVNDVPSQGGIAYKQDFEYCLDSQLQRRTLRFVMPENYDQLADYPVALYLPGIYEDHTNANATLQRLSEAGFIAIAASFRQRAVDTLQGEARKRDFVNMLIDARCAVRWVKAVAQLPDNPFKIDPSRVGIVAYSLGTMAGQMLAFMDDREINSAARLNIIDSTEVVDPSAFRYAVHGMLNHGTIDKFDTRTISAQEYELGDWFNVPERCWRSQESNEHCSAVSAPIDSSINAVVLIATSADALSLSTSCGLIHSDFMTTDKKSITTPVPVQDDIILCGPYRDAELVLKGTYEDQGVANIKGNLKHIMVTGNPFYYDEYLEYRFLTAHQIFDRDITRVYSPKQPPPADAEIIYPGLRYLPKSRRASLESISPINYRNLSPHKPPFLIISGADDAYANWEEAAMLASMLKQSGYYTKMIRFEGQEHGWGGSRPANIAHRDQQIGDYLHTVMTMQASVPADPELNYAQRFAQIRQCDSLFYDCPTHLSGPAYQRAWMQLYECQRPRNTDVTQLTCLADLVTVGQIHVGVRRSMDMVSSPHTRPSELHRITAQPIAVSPIHTGLRYEFDALAFDENFQDLGDQVIWELRRAGELSGVQVATGRHYQAYFAHDRPGQYVLTLKLPNADPRYTTHLPLSVSLHPMQGNNGDLLSAEGVLLENGGFEFKSSGGFRLGFMQFSIFSWAALADPYLPNFGRYSAGGLVDVYQNERLIRRNVNLFYWSFYKRGDRFKICLAGTDVCSAAIANL